MEVKLHETRDRRREIVAYKRQLFNRLASVMMGDWFPPLRSFSSIPSSTMTPFGHYLRSLRLGAGLGLRSFSKLIDQRPSTVSAIEQGQRLPWQTETILGRVANVLGLGQASPKYELLVDLANSGNLSGDQANNDELIPLVAIYSEGGSFDEATVEEVLNHLKFSGIPLRHEDPGDRLRLCGPTSPG